VLQLLGCYENWLKRRSGAQPLCGVAEILRSVAATGKPLAQSWVVVVGAEALGGVVAWKLAFFVDYGE
jgi:2-keto-4-pentenoate hydratase